MIPHVGPRLFSLSILTERRLSFRFLRDKGQSLAAQEQCTDDLCALLQLFAIRRSRVTEHHRALRLEHEHAEQHARILQAE